MVPGSHFYGWNLLNGYFHCNNNTYLKVFLIDIYLVLKLASCGPWPKGLSNPFISSISSSFFLSKNYGAPYPNFFALSIFLTRFAFSFLPSVNPQAASHKRQPPKSCARFRIALTSKGISMALWSDDDVDLLLFYLV